MFKLIYDKTDKTKTFTEGSQINNFIGAGEFQVNGGINSLMHQQVSPSNYVMVDKHEFWDDGTEMTPEEWVKCVMTIYQTF